IEGGTLIATLSARNSFVLVDLNDLVLELRCNCLKLASLIVGGLPVGGTDPQIKSRFHCHNFVLTTRWFIARRSNNEKPLFYRDKFFVLRRAFLAPPILCGFPAPDFANPFSRAARAAIVLAMPARWRGHAGQSSPSYSTALGVSRDSMLRSFVFAPAIDYAARAAPA